VRDAVRDGAKSKSGQSRKRRYNLFMATILENLPVDGVRGRRISGRSRADFGHTEAVFALFAGSRGMHKPAVLRAENRTARNVREHKPPGRRHDQLGWRHDQPGSRHDMPSVVHTSGQGSRTTCYVGRRFAAAPGCCRQPGRPLAPEGRR